MYNLGILRELTYNYEGARYALEKAWTSAISNDTVREAFAIISYQLEDFEESEHHFRRLACRNPEFPRYHLGLARALLQLRRLDEAEDSLQQALLHASGKHENNAADIWLEQGQLYSLRGNYYRAEKIFQTIFDIWGDHPVCFAYYGNLFEIQERSTEALTYYDQAIGHRPQFLRVWEHKAEIKRKMGKRDEAVKDLRNADPLPLLVNPPPLMQFSEEAKDIWSPLIPPAISILKRDPFYRDYIF